MPRGGLARSSCAKRCSDFRQRPPHLPVPSLGLSGEPGPAARPAGTALLPGPHTGLPWALLGACSPPAAPGPGPHSQSATATIAGASARCPGAEGREPPRAWGPGSRGGSQQAPSGSCRAGNLSGPGPASPPTATPRVAAGMVGTLSWFRGVQGAGCLCSRGGQSQRRQRLRGSTLGGGGAASWGGSYMLWGEPRPARLGGGAARWGGSPALHAGGGEQDLAFRGAPHGPSADPTPPPGAADALGAAGSGRGAPRARSGRAPGPQCHGWSPGTF